MVLVKNLGKIESNISMQVLIIGNKLAFYIDFESLPVIQQCQRIPIDHIIWFLLAATTTIIPLQGAILKTPHLLLGDHRTKVI